MTRDREADSSNQTKAAHIKENNKSCVKWKHITNHVHELDTTDSNKKKNPIVYKFWDYLYM